MVNKKFLSIFLIIFFLLSICIYFSYTILRSQEKVVKAEHTMDATFSIRAAFKAAILNQRGFYTYLMGLENNKQESCLKAIQYMQASIAFLYDVSTSKKEVINSLIATIEKNMQLIKTHQLFPNRKVLNQLDDNIDFIFKETEKLEKGRFIAFQNDFIEFETDELRQKNIYLFIAILLSFFGLILFILFLKQRSLNQRLKISEIKQKQLIAERETRLKALDKAERKLAQAQHIGRMGSWTQNQISKEVSWSDALYSLMGYNINEIKPDDQTYFQMVYPDDRAVVENTHQSSIQKGTSGYELEHRIVRNDADAIHTVIMTCEHETDSSGKIVESIITVQDITDRKKLEENLRQAQRIESVGSLAGGIAHDFNNILYPIVGMSEMLLEDLPAASVEHENAQEIFKAGIRGRDLVKQILTLSRQSTSKFIPVRFQHVLKEVLKLSRATIPANIEIIKDIQSDCGLILADPGQLHQIAMNLMTNAYHAVEQPDGKISVQLAEAEIGDNALKHKSIPPGRYAVLSVSDTGCGIGPEVMDKIFEPYFTTKEQGKGTGLGLAVVYGIVKEHNGYIEANSKLGKGTILNVYLPLSQGVTEIQPDEKFSKYETGTERILLVDDEEPVALLEKQMLKRLGYTVSSCTSSLEALEVFRASPDAFDLVVTDMTMPKMTGNQLAKELIPIRPDIPIIICTGFSEHINKERAIAIGIKDFLMKPVVKSEMAEVVRRVLDNVKDETQG